MYMQVESHSNSLLHLKRSPGIRSWSVLVGLSSIGIAAAYYSEDSLGWKLFYLVGCLFVATQNLEEWEEAIFEKDAGKVYLKSFSLYKKLLTFSRAGHEQVVVPLDEIQTVNVEEEKVRYFGKGYLIVLRFGTGFSHPLTQNAVMGCRSDVEAVANLIIGFLELNELQIDEGLETSSGTDVSDSEDQTKDK
ncbi:cytochrome b-245 chaperone 1 [Crotalus tigris]|uniref:cytochrome b-245 chaperone 1 n=1 Tax=Crotalus tigris TaxID=88082 RepID=UPI00192F160E|nr:cytochrome b-245 chaperone 1 [Crotalus tigris]